MRLIGKWLVPVIIGSAWLGSVGCGDDPETIVELTVIETIPVDFDNMQGGVIEGATINLDDLRDEPAYVDAVGSLRCGTVDTAASFIEVEALQVAAGATVLGYEVGVAPRGSAQFTRLATFLGSVTGGDKVGLTDARFAVDPAGLQVISQVVLGASPALSVQVTASVPGGVDDLQVALSLAIDFSSQASGCP